MCDQQSLRSACAYAQSDQSLCSSLEYSMTVKLLTEDNFTSLSLRGGCTGLSESTLVKMPYCWKSRAAAQLLPGLLDITSDYPHAAENVRCLVDNWDTMKCTWDLVVQYKHPEYYNISCQFVGRSLNTDNDSLASLFYVIRFVCLLLLESSFLNY